MSELALTGVVSGYKGTDVLRGIDLAIRPGECVAVLGPNGAGKSTLLKTISGQLKIRAGTSVLDGRDITGSRPHRVAKAGIRWIGDPRPIYRGLTVQDNLAVGGKIIGRDARARADWIYGLLPILAEKRLVPAGSLSGGQQQMLAIGQALMSRPSILCLDEPSLGLAPTVIHSLSALIGELTAEGMGIVWAEQFPEVALHRCTRAVVLSAGRIALQGAPSEIPRDRLQDVYMGIAVH